MAFKKQSVLLTLILFSSINCLFNNNAFGKTADTLVYYFRHSATDAWSNRASDVLVQGLYAYDYARIITRPDEQGPLKIEEYYRSGKLKLVGTTYFNEATNLQLGWLKLTGDCITFYPTGKRESTLHFDDWGNKDGDQYSFYPTGEIYNCERIVKGKNGAIDVAMWECYDKAGTEICKEGNGSWVRYNGDFKKIELSGLVKNGRSEGLWHGNTLRRDSIKYTILYKNGQELEKTGYDDSGRAYPYKQQFEKSKYGASSPLMFVEILLDKLKTPRDETGKKISTDTMHVALIIEKDGHASDFAVVGDVAQQVRDAFANAFAKCHNWLPGKYMGVPFRTQLILPLDVHGAYNMGMEPKKTLNLISQPYQDPVQNQTLMMRSSEYIHYKEKMLDF